MAGSGAVDSNLLQPGDQPKAHRNSRALLISPCPIGNSPFRPTDLVRVALPLEVCAEAPFENIPPHPSLAGGLVFYLVRGHTRKGCFHYIRCLGPVVGLGDGGFVPGAGVGSDGGECPCL